MSNCIFDFSSKKMEYAKQLRSISLPIISLESCKHYYIPKAFDISNKNICTLDEFGLKYCGAGDSGDPLVVEGELAGIFTVSEGDGGPHIPDVYMNLSHPEYRNWILSTVNYFTSNAQSLFHPHRSHFRV